jgi:hypothetical protein
MDLAGNQVELFIIELVEALLDFVLCQSQFGKFVLDEFRLQQPLDVLDVHLSMARSIPFIRGWNEHGRRTAGEG